VDLEQFDKKETKIEFLDIVQVKSQYLPEGINQWVLKASSEIITSIGEAEDKIDFRASELFNLSQDKEGKLIGYPESEDSNLARFMKDLKVKTPTEIIGKKVLIKSFEKNGKTYLKFRY
ncbi:MAG TPA: hypothetical protein VMZ91_13925, partial [Candidatus Paceibacterota bacterium]|nr:hypothetical protein [Candidatus Paceibacterota bacterium]